MDPVLFHLAFPIGNIEQAKQFYVEGLGCTLGRSSARAVTLGLYGHQMVGHVVKTPLPPQQGIYPRHFGLVFTNEQDWQDLVDRSRQKGLRFYQQPRRRFSGTPIEHRTFFLEDPFHNLLEFKFYVSPTAIFGEHAYDQVGDGVDGRTEV